MGQGLLQMTSWKLGVKNRSGLVNLGVATRPVPPPRLPSTGTSPELKPKGEQQANHHLAWAPVA